MSENRSKVDPVAWLYAREKIGRLLREMYNEPQAPSQQLSALLAKLRDDVPSTAEDPFCGMNQGAPK